MRASKLVRRILPCWQVPVTLILCTAMLMSVPPLWGCFGGSFFGINGPALICRSSKHVESPRELAFVRNQMNQKQEDKTSDGGSSANALLETTQTDAAQSLEMLAQGINGFTTTESDGEGGKEHGGYHREDPNAVQGDTGNEAQPFSLEEEEKASLEKGTFGAAGHRQACSNAEGPNVPGCASEMEGSPSEETRVRGIPQEALRDQPEEVGTSVDDGIAERLGERLGKEGTKRVEKEEGPAGEDAGGVGATNLGQVLEGGAQWDRPHPGCSPKDLIYVYDLPSSFHTDVISVSCAGSGFWSQHPRNACVVYSPEFGGMGPRLTGSEVASLDEIGSPVSSWADTGQFALEVMFHQYMLDSYPCRTWDGDSAAAFYVPIYTGMLHHNRTLHCDRATCPEYSPLGMVGRLLGAHLNKLPYLRRNGGRDHITTMGHVNFDGLQDDTCCTNGLLKTKHTKNFVIMGIESSVFTGPERQVSIPYPTCFHPGTPVEITAHQRLIQSSNRTALVSFAGQLTRDGLHWGRSVRQKIAEQCDLHPGDCQLVECNMECPCTKVLGAQLQAKFCLQPSGDSPTRRSLFDSLQAGCIPVLFHRASAYDEYTAFLPQDESSYSVFIPEDDVMRDEVDIIEKLRQIPEEELQRKRAVVASMLHSISYDDHRRARAHEGSATAARESAGSEAPNPLGGGSAYEVALAEALRRVERALETQ